MAERAELDLSTAESKDEVFSRVEEYLGALSLDFSSADKAKPWGGFYVIKEEQTEDFIDEYFPDLPRETIERGGKLSPKILVVEPGKRLSYQYHYRREELWRALTPVRYVISQDAIQGDPKDLQTGETVQFAAEVHHRLIGGEKWGVVAEIWQHTDPVNPSDENDIVRVEDDFGR